MKCWITFHQHLYYNYQKPVYKRWNRKIKYINMNKLGDVFERHPSPTVWCPACLQESSGMRGTCSYVGGAGQCFVRTELFIGFPWGCPPVVLGGSRVLFRDDELVLRTETLIRRELRLTSNRVLRTQSFAAGSADERAYRSPWKQRGVRGSNASRHKASRCSYQGGDTPKQLSKSLCFGRRTYRAARLSKQAYGCTLSESPRFSCALVAGRVSSARMYPQHQLPLAASGWDL